MKLGKDTVSIVNDYSIKFSDRYVKYILDDNRINTKFFLGLLKIAKDENIPIIYYKNSEELTLKKYNNLDRLICGLYTYNYNIINRIKYYNKPICINISLNNKKIEDAMKCPYFVSTLAHELGHHFSLKLHNDSTEQSADHYIRNLAEQILTTNELMIIDSTLSIYEGKLFYYDKNNIIEGREFFDMDKYILDELNFKKTLKNTAKHYIINKYKNKINHSKFEYYFIRFINTFTHNYNLSYI
jgi:hypothetical protein